jgi:translocation and assembly module TamB
VIRGTISFSGQRFELPPAGRLYRLAPAQPAHHGRRHRRTSRMWMSPSTSPGTRSPRRSPSARTPGLPQDEILARILFGGSVTELSALQVVQLGASLNSLRGGSGGLNPLGALRGASGLSRLRVLGGDEAQGRGTALAAGFYLGNDIYLEVITDARGFTATQIEIALTRALSILSQAGSNGNSSLNVRYRKNY